MVHNIVLHLESNRKDNLSVLVGYLGFSETDTVNVVKGILSNEWSVVV